MTNLPMGTIEQLPSQNTDCLQIPCSDLYRRKSILVTGAGGSIGSVLCKQLLSFAPRRLVLFDLSEFALYTMLRQLEEPAAAQQVELVPILGSVSDAQLVRQALHSFAVDHVFHAAAYKHVPLAETNAVVSVSNNVLGTLTVARESGRFGVQHMVLISSDKAVRPTNVMGASKRLAELTCQYQQDLSPETTFHIVRFGNVAGSSGSVLPLFEQQVRQGGPITLTHPAMRRYFMSVQNAVDLVLGSSCFAHPGDILVLDMGDPVHIKDLARRVIEAAGKTVRDTNHPQGDIEIKITGLRPGEKLCEEMSLTGVLHQTAHAKILCAKDPPLSTVLAAAMLRDVQNAVASFDHDRVVEVLKTWVEGFQTCHISALPHATIESR